MDREKVIKGLECHQIDNNNRINCSDCPYYVDDDNHIRCVNDLHDDALALLKEQETMMQCIKGKCRICPHCANCDVDENGLLKEQEAVKPKSKVRHGANAQIQHFCGNCNSMLHGKPKYCSECGKGVLW